MDWLKALDISRQAFQRYRDELTRRLGLLAEPSDVVWSILNERVSQTPAITAEGCEFLASTYHNMASFLYEEGKDFFAVKQEAQTMVLTAQLRKRQRDGVKVLAALDSCSACRKLDGKIFTLSQALEAMPLPVRDCTYELKKKQKMISSAVASSETQRAGWCRCIYIHPDS